MRYLFASAAVAALMIAGKPSLAAPVLDQENWVDVSKVDLPSGITLVSGGIIAGTDEQCGQSILQTITSGLSGSLAQIEIRARRSSSEAGNLRLTLYDGNATQDTPIIIGNVDISSSILSNDFNSTALFDVSELEYKVVNGQLFSYRISIDYGVISLPYGIGLLDELGNLVDIDSPVYDGGDRYYGYADGSTWFYLSPHDGSFRTYVDPTTSAIPEPATWAMLISGFGVVGAAARRRPAIILRQA